MRLLREAAAQESDWRPLIDSLRPHLPALWGELPMEQRGRFLRHVRWAWDRVRHRMPPQVDTAISELEGEGRLRRMCGRMQSVHLQDDALQVTFRHAGLVSSIEAGMVIQATGLETDVRRSPGRLVSQLLTNAHVVADPLGLGLQSDADGRLRHGDTHWPNLFAIGSLLRGSLWETTAMPEISRQARRLADQLVPA